MGIPHNLNRKWFYSRSFNTENDHFYSLRLKRLLNILQVLRVGSRSVSGDTCQVRCYTLLLDFTSAVYLALQHFALLSVCHLSAEAIGPWTWVIGQPHRTKLGILVISSIDVRTYMHTNTLRPGRLISCNGSVNL